MTRSVRDLMWSDALVRLSVADRLHREALRPAGSGREPLIDVLQVEIGLLVIVALPGVRRETCRSVSSTASCW